LEKVIKSYQVVQNDNGKYVVYDSKGKLVIMSTAKNICREFIKDKCRVRKNVNK
tara:strand:+ start:497 stop:658 length:162 start_codon:yes stop_codon:yes gene_type:complete